MIKLFKHTLPNVIYTILFLSWIMVMPSCNKKGKDAHDNMEKMNVADDANGKSQNGDHGNMDGMDMGEHKTKNIKIKNSYPDSLYLSTLVVPDNFQVVSSQPTVKPVRSIPKNNITVQGYIAPDERRHVKVPVRVSGRIEKLYVKYNLQYVKKGEKIMDLYSQELNTYQEEMLFLMKNNSLLLANAEEKLGLLGVSKRQIEDIKKTGKTFFTLDVVSPQSGYVFFNSSNQLEKNVAEVNAKSNSGDKMKGMGGNNASSGNITSGSNQVREGNYINKGEVLFWINDLQKVWAMIAVDNSHQQKLKPGLKVYLVSEFHKNDTIDEVVDFIEPVYQNNQKVIMSRIYLNNTEKKYKINSLVEVIINTLPTTPNLIPYSSVFFLGKKKIVWVLKKKIGKSKIFEARDITIGIMHSEMVEVITGLNANEEIALNAGYLLDRESLVQTK